MMSKTVLNQTYCKVALNKTGIPGYRYCLNPYVGYSHGCRTARQGEVNI
ncbi:MAG: hypothetical protein ACPLRU_06015 [Desulfofundulus sp.]